MKKDPDAGLVTLTVSGDRWVICNLPEAAKQFENKKKEFLFSFRRNL